MLGTFTLLAFLIVVETQKETISENWITVKPLIVNTSKCEHDFPVPVVSFTIRKDLWDVNTP